MCFWFKWSLLVNSQFQVQLFTWVACYSLPLLQMGFGCERKSQNKEIRNLKIVRAQPTLLVATRDSTLLRSVLVCGQCAEMLVVLAASTADGGGCYLLILPLGHGFKGPLSLTLNFCSSTLNFTYSYLAKGSSRTPFMPGPGYRESGGHIASEHLDTCH